MARPVPFGTSFILLATRFAFWSGSPTDGNNVIFNGVQSLFPSGVFTSKESAEAWISGHGLTGTLTEYPIDVGMYEYAISMGHFEPSKPEHKTALFIGKFSGGAIGHCHYEDGDKG